MSRTLDKIEVVTDKETGLELRMLFVGDRYQAVTFFSADSKRDIVDKLIFLAHNIDRDENIT